MIKIKFFTNPLGITIPLKYITINPYHEQQYIEYIVKFRPREILLDTGVDYLFNILNYRDYPKGWINRYVVMIGKVYSIIRRYNIKLFIVIPDIPVDYEGREHLYPWNVKRTLEYIRYFLDNVMPKYEKITFIAPVQGKRDSISSVLKTYVENIDLYREFKYIAIAPTCTTRKYKLLAELITRFDHAVSHNYGEHKYHVFGPGLKTIQLIASKVRNMYSFDSTAYFYYNHKRVCAGRERTESLIHFCKKLPSNVLLPL